MKDLKDMIEESLQETANQNQDDLNESRTNPKEITAYITSWLKNPIDDKDMYAILGAIVQGVHDAYDYRTDPEYLDPDDKKYEKANEALKKFMEQLK